MTTKAKKAPKKATRPAKPTHTVCLSCPPKLQLVKHRIKDMHRNENGRLVCADCYAPPLKAKKAGRPDKWYVLQVEPNKESQVRKDILKQVRIRNLEGQIKRVMSPTCLVERVGPRVGDVLAEGTYEFDPTRVRQGEAYRFAKELAYEAARVIYLKRNPDLEAEDVAGLGPTEFDGLRVTANPGKKPGVIEWKVREYFPDESVRKVLRGRKYPGYMLVNMEFNVETERVLKTTRNAWGLLLQPVVTGHLIKIHVTKPTRKMADDLGGWAKAMEECVRRGARWRVVEPDGGKVVAKGWARDKTEARAAAEKAKATAEEFHPTALADQEAAEALIAQQAVNQILKDKEELNKAVCNLRGGDAVRVKAGAFRGCRGEVVRVVKNPKDKSDVKVELKCRVLGVDVPATVQHFECERTTPGDRDD